MLFVGDLTLRDKRILSHPSNNNLHPLACEIILLSGSEKTVQEISQLVGLHPINVRKWIHRFKNYGTTGLRIRKSPGRPPKFGPEVKAKILSLIKQDPVDYGYTYWSLSKIQQTLIDLGVVDSISTTTIDTYLGN